MKKVSFRILSKPLVQASRGVSPRARPVREKKRPPFRVYVTDQVEGIVPEYLTLLHGVIDSPDIRKNTLLYQLWRESRDKNIALSHLSGK
ncbi:hypothetical protein [Anaerotruncus massiliensis (ex Liu et al. 2021)]|uniref:hypothetical protein n=1 Tax=Anaerotruncus massiliensis (ex Liu et al. 2021) TaxID=2321404 RepID=UPI003AB5B246